MTSHDVFDRQVVCSCLFLFVNLNGEQKSSFRVWREGNTWQGRSLLKIRGQSDMLYFYRFARYYHILYNAETRQRGARSRSY